jgi:hypothetical protein
LVISTSNYRQKYSVGKSVAIEQISGSVFPTIITMSLSQASHITHVPQGNDLKPNSCENHENEGWTLVPYKNKKEEKTCTKDKYNYNKES